MGLSLDETLARRDQLLAAQAAQAPYRPLSAQESNPGPLTEAGAGVERGLRGMAGGAVSAVGLGVNALDADDAARWLYRQGNAISQGGPQPRVGALGDVGSVRDALDYAAGAAGEFAPAVGVGALTGGSGAPMAALRSAALFAPSQIGGVVQGIQAQQGDPSALLTPEQMGRAVLAGGGSAMAMAALPAVVGGQLRGAGTAGGAASLRGVLARNAATELPVQAGMMGGSDVVQQWAVDPVAPIDWKRAGEAGVAGAVGALPAVGLGALGQYAHVRIGQGKNDAKNAPGKVSDAASGVFGKVADKVGQMQERLREKFLGDPVTPQAAEGQIHQALHGDASAATLADLAGEGFMGDLQARQAFAREQDPARAAQMLAQSDAARQNLAERLWGKAQGMAGSVGQTGRRMLGAIAQAGGAGTPEGRKGLKAFLDWQSAVQRTKDTFADLADTFGHAAAQGRKDAAGIKQSAEQTPLGSQMLDIITAHLPEGALEEDAARGQAARVLREFIGRASDVAEGGPQAGERLRELIHANQGMIELFGPDAAPKVAAQLYEVVGSAEPAAREAFFGNVAQMREQAQRKQAMRDRLTALVMPSGHFRVDAHGMDAITDSLTRWINGELYGAAGRAEQQEIDRRMTQAASAVFGPQTPKALAALKQYVGARFGARADSDLTGAGDARLRETAQDWDPEGDAAYQTQAEHALEQAGQQAREHPDGSARTLYVGHDGYPRSHVSAKDQGEAGRDDPYGGVINALLRSPEYQRRGGPDSRTDRMVGALARQNPGYDVSFVSLLDHARENGVAPHDLPEHFPELRPNKGKPQKPGQTPAEIPGVPPEDYGTYGYIRVRGAENEGVLRDADLEAMRYDSRRYGNQKKAHPDRVLKFETRAKPGESAEAFAQRRKDLGETVEYDPIAMTRHFRKKAAFSESDDLSPKHRTANAFEQAYAALADKHGHAPPLDDQTAIAFSKDGEPLTVGQARELSYVPESTRYEQRPDAVLRERDWARDAHDIELRARTRAVQDGVLKLTDQIREPLAPPGKGSAVRRIVDEESLAGKRERLARGEALLDVLEREHQRRHQNTDREQVLDTDGTGRYEIDPYEGQTHEVAAFYGNGGKPVHKGMDGADLSYAADKDPGVVDHSDAIKDLVARQNLKDGFDPARAQRLASYQAEHGTLTPDGHATYLRQLNDHARAWAERWSNTAASAASKGVIARALKQAQALGEHAQYFDPILRTRLRGLFDAHNKPSEVDQALPVLREDAAQIYRKRAELRRRAEPEHPAANEIVPSQSQATPEVVVGEAPKPEQGRNPKAPASEPQGRVFSRESTAGETRREPLPEAPQHQIRDYAHKVLGPQVKVIFDKAMGHAGEYHFDAAAKQAVLRLAATARDPMGTAHHEAFHAFLEATVRNDVAEVSRVVKNVANSPVVMNQLRKALAHSPEALAQLSDREEAAAYAYQFWSKDPQGFKLSTTPRSFFQRIKAAIMQSLGVITDGQRAEQVFKYFESGQFAQDPQSVARQDFMNRGGGPLAEKLKVLHDLWERWDQPLFAAGQERMREGTEIPSLDRIADLVKLRLTREGDDPGYEPAARLAYTREINRFTSAIDGASDAQVSAALKALQTGTPPADAQSREGQIYVQVRAHLDHLFKYVNASGVILGDQGYGKDYFPRVWDTAKITQDPAGFKAMLLRHGIPATVMHTLLDNEGRVPGTGPGSPAMNAERERALDNLSPGEAARWQSDNLRAIMGGYIRQATRRAEWARRFGADNGVLERLLKSAKEEGATPKQILMADKYLKGVAGTLGGEMNPRLKAFVHNATVYQNLRTLPLMIFSSLVDPMGIAVRGGSMSDVLGAYKRGFAEMKYSFRKDTPGDVPSQLAETLGVIERSALAHYMSDVYADGATAGLAQKINDKFFRWNLNEQWNRSMRVAATQAAVRAIRRYATEDGPHNERWLRETGLTRDDFQADGEVKSAAQERWTAAVNRWVDGAVLRPDKADSTIWMNDPNFKLLAQYKQFVFSFQHTILDRVVHEAKLGHYRPALALAGYVPIMLAADLARGMIQGGGSLPGYQQGWDLADFLGDAVSRAGLYGTRQFDVGGLLDAKHAGDLAGPTLSQGTQWFDAVRGKDSIERAAFQSLPAYPAYKWAQPRAGAGTDAVQ